MADGTCIVSGCDTHGRVRRGMCGRHYQRWQRNGDPVTTGPNLRATCAVNQCDKPLLARGVCRKHYVLLRETGTTDPRPKRTPLTAEQKQARRKAYYERVEKPRAAARPCRVEGCTHSANKLADLCVGHHWRIKRYGDPHATAPWCRSADMIEYLDNYQPNATPICEIEGCGEPVRMRNLCGAHYKTFRKYGHPLGEQVPRKAPTPVPRGSSPEVRFWAKVDRDGPVPTHRPDLGPCWVWLAGLDSAGYGTFGTRKPGESRLAHRYSWRLDGRTFTEGLVLDHVCRVHWCVRPDHLREIDSVSNVMIGDTPTAANARKTHCKHNHPFDEVNTYHNPSRPGHRGCRTCMRIKQRDRSRRMRAAGRVAA
jgi:hypothetical protein